jgi:hypothetical protein
MWIKAGAVYVRGQSFGRCDAAVHTELTRPLHLDAGRGFPSLPSSVIGEPVNPARRLGE